MFIIGNLIGAIATVLNMAITLYWWLIVIRALASWLNPDPYNPVVQFLYRATEPVLEPLRRLVPPFRLGMDVSPVLAILLLIFIQRFVIDTLFQISIRLQ